MCETLLPASNNPNPLCIVKIIKALVRIQVASPEPPSDDTSDILWFTSLQSSVKFVKLLVRFAQVCGVEKAKLWFIMASSG